MAWTKFKRIEDSANIDSIDVEDGAFIITKDGKSYADFDNERVPIAGTPDDEMDDTSRNTVENKVIKDYVDTELNLYETKGKIIWTNPDPSINFPAQTVTLNESLDNYDMYAIIFRQSVSASRYFNTGKIIVGYGTILDFSTSATNWRPTGTTVNGNTITFEDGRTGNTVDNSYLIPMYVIGYNTGLFE